LAEIKIIALPRLPHIQPGDDLALAIWRALEGSPVALEEGDVLVVAQKAVSKAEGSLVCLKEVSPSAQAYRLAEETGKDPRLVEVILRESSRVLRARPGRLIVEQRLGIICANAGVDRSNVAQKGGPWASLLPLDPDASAEAIRARLKRLSGRELAVIISDSQGRPFRQGSVGVAIGVAGLRPLDDRRGQTDLYGRPLASTVVALADQLASAAALALGEAGEGTPVVVVRGVGYQQGRGSARELLRPREEDLFR
jgi:coenzyme F420-0:L-glutamate ligase/coenzyme F420-1:gamma-L-glutamate ligase